jgi:protein-S-isoprenylcysteine O-methyltransferase Ste14
MNSELVFRIAFFVVLGLMLIVRMVFNVIVQKSGERIMPDREAIHREGVGMFALRFVMFFVLITVLVLYAIRHPWMNALDFNLPPWLRWLGFVIGLLSVALITWVELELGRQYSPQLQLRQEHHLVTSGPYTRIRHPLYLAVDCFGLSLALISANWLFAAFFALGLVLLFYRIPREEQMLIDQFGDDYRDYMQHTGRILPKF